MTYGTVVFFILIIVFRRITLLCPNALQTQSLGCMLFYFSLILEDITSRTSFRVFHKLQGIGPFWNWVNVRAAPIDLLKTPNVQTAGLGPPLLCYRRPGAYQRS